MPTVDFVYDKDCPNVKAARANLMRAFSVAELSAHWSEHQVGARDAPAHVRGFGSPTVLVDGVDVGGATAEAEDCCRVYGGDGVPAVELIAEALLRAGQSDAAQRAQEPRPRPRRRWRSTAALLPGIGVALLPKVVCPLCWPAYAGVLGAAGLTFLMEDRWLLPISGAFLVAALAALAWRARSRRGYGPLSLGAGSATAILVGRFVMDSTAIVYFGIAALVLAGVWNAWPRRVLDPSCSVCRPVTTQWNPIGHKENKV